MRQEDTPQKLLVKGMSQQSATDFGGAKIGFQSTVGKHLLTSSDI